MTEEPNRTRGIQAEMLVGVSAVVIGVCALGVSLYETSLMREQQRAAVLPILELGRSFYLTPEDQGTEEWRLSFSAENVGIGPARVVDFVVTVDGQPQATWGEAMRTLLDRKVDVRYGQSTISGRTIPPDRSITMFELADRSLARDIMERSSASIFRLAIARCSTSAGRPVTPRSERCRRSLAAGVRRSRSKNSVGFRRERVRARRLVVF